MNTVTISGNVGRDPELRFSQSGTATCTFSLAVNEKNGNESVTHWFDVVCFKTTAESVSESIQKGMAVLVSGKLQQRTWETPEGEPRSKIEIVAWNVAPDLTFASAVVTKNPRPERANSQ